MGRRFLPLLVLAGVMVSSGAVFAGSLDNILLENEGRLFGSGSSQAILVVDFGRDNGQADSFAWGVNFDGSFSGYELLETVIAESSLEVKGTDYGLPAGGFFMERMVYGDHSFENTASQVGTVARGDGWTLWQSTDFGENWTKPTSSGYEIGISQLAVSDNLLVGWIPNAWTWDTGTYNFVSYPVPPVAPLESSPVPEPSSLVLVLAGSIMAGGLWARRRFRRRAA